MIENVGQVALRIKYLREINNLSVETLARELSVSKELYISYEKGNIDIPISFLFSVANKFNVQLISLLSGDSPKLKAYSMVKSGGGLTVESIKDYKCKSIAYNFINQNSEIFLVTIDSNPIHETVTYNSHSGQEFNYVLKGSVKIIIDNHEMILNEGDSIYFNSALKHRYEILDNTPVHFMAVITK